MTQAIPPDAEPEVRPIGPVRFSIDFLAVDKSARPGVAQSARAGEQPQQRVQDEGGDPACWAGLLCPECGAVLDGGLHPRHCPAARRE